MGTSSPSRLASASLPRSAWPPAGCFDSLASVPLAGWLQIMVTMCMIETGNFLGRSQTGGYAAGPMENEDGEVGDIAAIGWVRYDDPETKLFKLNAERQNGRAAMLGITGCLSHELLGVDALYPTGGMGGAAPPTIF